MTLSDHLTTVLAALLCLMLLVGLLFYVQRGCARLHLRTFSCVHMQVREDDCLTQLAVPRGCGPGGAKCIVTLSWEVVSEGKEMKFGITADLTVAKGVTSHGSWAAVGFSPDGKMVIICTQHL